MSRVYVGSITPEGEHILTSYLNRYMPDAVIEPLKRVGIKGRMRNTASRPDVALIIIDESLYDECVGVVDDVLSMPKVHKYLNDESLNEFLIRWFGKLDDADFAGLIPPDKIVEDDESDMIVVDDTQSDSDSEATIAELQTKLAQSELLVNNLTMQLQDSSSGNDVSAFIDRIKELETDLSNKEEELRNLGTVSLDSQSKLKNVDKLTEEVTKIKQELRTAREDKAQLEHNLSVLEQEKNILQGKLDTLSAEGESTSDAQLRIELEAMTTSYTDLNRKYAELEAKNADNEVVIEELNKKEGISEQLEQLKGTVSEQALNIQNLNVDLDTKTSKCESLKGTIAELNTLLDEKESQLTAKEADLAKLVTDNRDLQTDIEDLNARINSLTNKVLELNGTLSEKLAEISRLHEENSSVSEQIEGMSASVELLGHKDAEINMLKQSIREYESTTNSLNKTLDDLKDKLAVKEGEVDAYKKRSEDALTSLNSALADNLDLKNDLNDITQHAEALEIELSNLREVSNTSSKQIEEQLQSVTSELTEYKDSCKKQENEILILKSQLEAGKTDSTMLETINSELLEEKRLRSRVEAELRVLKEGNSVITTNAESVAEIERLRKELSDLKASGVTTSTNTVEDSEYREKYALLEADLAVCKEELDEYQNGTFGQIANIALPKAAYNVKLMNEMDLGAGFVCIVSGSSESNLVTYQLLKTSCIKSKKSILVLDLSTDSSIDRAFNVVSVKSPVPWLTGSADFTDFVADTKVPNVRVMSIALTYINDLALLNVNWEKKLNDLKGYADLIILNLGCMNNFVTKILYNTFSNVMQGNVIVKATPVNLRTVILNLTGFKPLVNTLVSCVNFDNSSKILYQKLVEKCNTQILKDTDILRL